MIARHRIGYVDGLRAVAVLTVVASHSIIPSLIGQSVGVGLFFVISGFCLSYPTLAKVRDGGETAFDVCRYGAHRIVRILPPYFAAIALLFVLGLFVAGFTHVSALDAIRQALFLDNQTVLLTPPFWSLPVEFRWYFLFPIALWLWLRSPRAFVAATLLLVVAAEATRATSVDLVALPAFLSGIIAAYVRIWGHRLAPLALPACLLAALVAYFRTGVLFSPFWEAAVFLMVVAAGAFPWLSRLLSMKWLTSIGLVSYSIYLVHDPVIVYAMSRGANPIIAALLGVAAGAVFWYIAERPFVQGSIRARLIGEFETVFAKWFPRFGVSRMLHVSYSPAPAHAVDGLTRGFVDVPSATEREAERSVSRLG